MKRGTMYSWPSVTWYEISTHTTDQHMPKHSYQVLVCSIADDRFANQKTLSLGTASSL